MIALLIWTCQVFFDSVVNFCKKNLKSRCALSGGQFVEQVFYLFFFFRSARSDPSFAEVQAQADEDFAADINVRITPAIPRLVLAI